ncbi:MAG: GNAT family N-acetyltransferase [Halobacillus sp.]|uniref:GNAT family N-acetyltransferase n=1 Tax=Halobacillus sp. TaxID=56800 RepID=UPI003BB182E4
MNVRQYHPKDLNQVQSLFQKTFKQERSYELWDWKFKQNPKSDSPFILVWEENDTIQGHISLWVTEAYLSGEKSTIGLRVDTMVDPEARGKGIYKQLNEALLREASDAGIDYLYGFPAPKARELFIRYTDAVHLTDMPRWMYVQRPVSVLASKFAPLKLLKPLDLAYAKWKNPYKPTSSSLHWKNILECGPEFDDLARETRHIAPALVVRDAAYLNWRYLSHPENEYEIHAVYHEEVLQGYVVTKITTSSGFKNGLIVDMLANEEEIWEALLQKSFDVLKQTDVIQTWALAHTPLAAHLKNNGFTHKDSPMPLVGKEINESLRFLNQSSKWYITPGDVDSY